MRSESSLKAGNDVVTITMGKRNIPLSRVEKAPAPSRSSEWEIAWSLGKPEGRWTLKRSGKHRRVA